MKIFWVFILISVNAWSVETEKNKIQSKLRLNQKNSEVLEIIEGPSQDRRYKLVSNVGGKCRAESPTQWNEKKRFQTLLKLKNNCQEELEAKYHDLNESGEVYCHEGLIFITDSAQPMEETRYFMNNSKAELGHCYTVFDPLYKGDYEFYFSAIMRRQKR